jgi:hypothetical protein
MESNETVFFVNLVSFVNFVRNLPFCKSNLMGDVGSHKVHKVHEVHKFTGDGTPLSL